jgi:hypothetical protein
VTNRQEVEIIKFQSGAKKMFTQSAKSINNFKRFNPCWENKNFNTGLSISNTTTNMLHNCKLKSKTSE